MRAIAKLLINRYRRRFQKSFVGYQRALQGAPRARALISYVTLPFFLGPTSRTWFKHQNLVSIRCMADTLNRAGFVVDAIDFRDTNFTPIERYDLFLGIGENFARLTPLVRPHAKVIYYATGAHWAHYRTAVENRAHRLFLRRGTSMGLERYQSELPYAEMADMLIVVGNEWTASTYGNLNNCVRIIDEVFPGIPVEPRDKKMNEARNHFLWLGGRSFLNKGLDLLLEVFSTLPEQQLYICGGIPDGPFAEAYRKELFATKNIHCLGWIDLSSRRFSDLVYRCASMIFPSCSEGASGSMITAMRSGLIPVGTRQVGVDITSNYGFLLPDDEISTIRDTVLQIARDTSSERLEAMASEARCFSHSKFTENSYECKFAGYLRELFPWVRTG